MYSFEKKTEYCERFEKLTIKSNILDQEHIKKILNMNYRQNRWRGVMHAEIIVRCTPN